MKHITKIYLFTMLTFLMLIPGALSAAEIRVSTDRVNVGVGDQFLISVDVYSTESINTLEGKIIFPENKLVVKEINDGGSVINFWIDKPFVSEGAVSFSGITPGGFTGVNSHIVSVLFEAKEAGPLLVEINTLKALINDGLGTEAKIGSNNISLMVREKGVQVDKKKVIDTELPEDFTPLIAEDPSLFEGKKFLVFATEDKISGIDHYEVREGGWGFFRTAESPYLLKHQSLDRKIFIRAIDKSSNKRVVVMEAHNPSAWYQQYALSGIILLLIAFIFFKKIIWPRFIK